MIRIESVTKLFTDFKAVDSVSLEIKEGELFSLLGPNGAGKTTLMKMIVGLLNPTSGNVFIDEHGILKEPVAAKRLMGYIPDRPFVYEKLTGREYLLFVANMYHLDENNVEKRAHELIELFSLANFEHELIEGYSHGMKQRLVFASAMIHNPKYLIVDEPMVGLDPRGITLLKAIFRSMRKKGRAILMSTHDLHVAEQLSDRVGIINEGRIIALGTPQELREQADIKGGTLESVFLKLTHEDTIEDLDL
ncbi:MAG: ABC transporter ATP-binding protein [Deltaproteobacteria bacterium]|nr:ABC transporter ATP-binding protein [Deltaproteobacteria bacterium]